LAGVLSSSCRHKPNAIAVSDQPKENIWLRADTKLLFPQREFVRGLDYRHDSDPSFFQAAFPNGVLTDVNIT
jgi:hypothetical protein